MTIENNVAFDKIIHWKIGLAFPRTANSGALRLTGNQPIKDAWLLGPSTIFKVVKFTKNSAGITGFMR